MIRVVGGGPAGSCAAITARRMGCPVELVERSKFPRHKVCGEFLSPEIAPLLEEAGVLERFLSAGPARIRRFRLHFGRTVKSAGLPEPAYGLSRSCFDELLFRHAIEAGASHVLETEHRESLPSVLATGRVAVASGADRTRTFGFKAHFRGPADDGVELYFFDGCYAGVSAVEGGITNVCGLGPEPLLKSLAFDIDRLLVRSPALAARLRPLERSFDWLVTGPLVYRQAFRDAAGRRHWLAGDRLSFVDPFTGSGLLAAVLTGSLAGRAAVERTDPAGHLAECRRALRRPFGVSTVFRRLAAAGWAERLVGLVPGRILFDLTRPVTTKA